eukprot:1061755-Amphidinium_carterae.1
MYLGRARYSDLLHAKSVKLDLAPGTERGYIEVTVTATKTQSVTGHLGYHLDMVAPAVGVAKVPWAKSWYHDLAEAGLLDGAGP